MGEALDYDLPMPREDFHLMDCVVRAVRRGNFNLPKLRLITNGTEKLSVDQHMYVQNDPMCLGVTFGDWDQGDFAIWITSTLKRFDTNFARDTLLHELCHGYFHCYKHGQQFRRYLGRVMYHYKWLVCPEFNADEMLHTMVSRYSRDTKGYVEMELKSLAKASQDEKTYVAERFEELRNAEALVMHVA